MPDGQVVNFPESMSREQIKQAILTKYPPVEQPAQPQEVRETTEIKQISQDPGLFQNIGQDLSERGQQFQDILAAKRGRQQTMPETGMQLIGTGIGS